MKNKLLIGVTTVLVTGCLVGNPLQALAEEIKTSEPQKNITQVGQIEKAVVKGEQEPFKVGKYTVSVVTLKVNKDELSMAGQYIDQKSFLEVIKDEKNKNKKSSNKKYLSINVRRSDWMKNIKVMIDGKEVAHTSKMLKTYEEKNQLGKNKIDHTIRFEIPKVDANIKLGMDVVPMGNASVEFRLDLQDDITKLELEAIKKQVKIKEDDENDN